MLETLKTVVNSNVFWGILGLLSGIKVNRYREYITTNKPLRAFWKPFFDGGLSIVTPDEEREEMIRSQVYDYIAINEAEKIFVRLFSDYHYDRFTCNDILVGKLNQNLLLVGGPKANSITKDVFSRSKIDLIYSFSGNDIIHNKNKVISRQCEFKDKENLITTDYGIITKYLNPYNKDKLLLIVSGCYGWGTWGAIMALLDPESFKFLLKKESEFYQVIVCVSVLNKRPIRAKIQDDSYEPL